MTQEEKLLLKDLCARLPYKVKCYGFQQKIDGNDNECYGTLKRISNYDFGWKFILNDRVPLNNRKCYEESYHKVKPYLFPLSSMTEEQYKEFIMISGWDVDIEDVRRGKFSCIGYIGFDYLYDAEDWFNKNHFDWRDLIPKNLAIDCTNLNIY